MAVGMVAVDSAAVDLARESVYRFLSAVLSDPRGGRFRLAQDAADQRLACQAAALLREDAAPAGRRGLGELPAEALDLANVCEHLRRPLDALLTEYDRAFGLAAGRDCPPFETEYHPNSDPFFRAQQMADVAGFYRAFGLSPSQDLPERPDHAVLELEFMAFVLLKKRMAQFEDDRDGAAENVAVCDQAQQSFFRDHVAWWLPAFATGLRRKSGDGLYAAAGRALAALVHAERCRLGVDTASISGLPDRSDGPEEPGACGGCTADR